MATSRFTPVVAVNASAGVIPRYAVVEPTGGVDVDGNIQVGKPTRSNGIAVLFNGPVSVPVGGVFSAWPPTPAAVAGVSLGDGGADPGDLPLATGAALGTKAGDWFLRAGQSGFRSVAPPTLGAVQVVLDFGGGTGGTGGGIYARITGNAGKRYAFTQVAVRAENPPGTVTDDAIDVPGGVVGTTSAGWAYDIGGGSAALHTPAPALVVLMTPNPLVAGTWLFGPVTVCP